MGTEAGRTRIQLSGLPVSAGYAIGKVRFVHRKPQSEVVQTIPEERVPYEISLFEKAHARSLREVELLRSQMSETISAQDAGIFRTHVQILQDPKIAEDVPKLILEEHLTAASAVYKVTHELSLFFEKIASGDKARDIDDIADRLIGNLSEETQALNAPVLDGECVIVAHNVTPSLLAGADTSKILALATDTGGATSHVAILARSLRIPAVVGLNRVSLVAKDGDTIVLDGVEGDVVVNPDEEELERYRQRRRRWIERQSDIVARSKTSRPETLDGKYVPMLANVELPEETANALELGAEGVGLLRSEFLFFRGAIPTEEEQFQAYRLALESAYPNPVTIRTVDTGGDKLVKGLSLSDEPNPVMGWRSIRVCLDEPAMFRTQLRALLRASVYGHLKVMFPMVGGYDELTRAKALLDEVRSELERDRIPVAESVEVGMMVEVPSAVMQIKSLVREVDFLSIGTNDLIQFTLAVDRSNEKVKDLYRAHHPSVLRLINMVCDAAHDEGITVSVCGEMASDMLSMVLLVGLGVDELSLIPARIAGNKAFLQTLSYSEMRSCALESLKMKTADEIDALLLARYG
ncbi:MAG: phosphoenolpyruvate--protein phosphotransferase, partial [Fibrobacterales bacterium]|nr:phosphoenolpyruvate--protein phosphotransferase [Fibrobacterales bacterium]